MKLSIEKQPHGTIKISLTTDPASRPLVIEVQPQQVGLITQMLETAARANKFKFECEL